MKFKCLVCSSYQQKKYRYNKKFCSYICWLQYHYKICKCCYNEFFANKLSQRYCNSCINNNKVSQKHYKENKKEKKCKKCGDFFIGKRQELLCDNCKQLPHHEYNDIIKKILCPCCGGIIKEKIVKKTKRTCEYSYNKYKCEKCRQKDKEEREEIRLLKQKEKEEKQLLKKKEKEEREEMSLLKKKEKEEKEKLLSEEEIKSLFKRRERKRYYRNKYKNLSIEEREKEIEKSLEKNKIRMIENNPMFDPKIKEKVRKTIKRKITSGEIVYKTGKDHHLWKGNRNFNKLCRDYLYKRWSIFVLKRDNFTCTMCDRTGIVLHVHHIRPLREIIKKILKEYNIENVNSIDVNSDLCFEIIDNVINDHNLNDGITVCPDCHYDIDYYYRRKTHEN